MKEWIKNNKLCFIWILVAVFAGLGALFNWVIYPDSCYLKATEIESRDDEGNTDTSSVYSMNNVCERHRFAEELLLKYQKDMQDFEDMQKE